MIQNWLTIDVEDYFQVHALSRNIQPEEWNQYECRVEKNTLRILDLLDTTPGPRPAATYELSAAPRPRATFFILGWIARRYPHLVKEIHSRGHEIASHGYGHQVIYHQTRDQFREDVRTSKKLLEDLIGEPVNGYRAPTYSIVKKTLWALHVLAEEGYRYDSSVFPIRHDYYGMPSAPRFPFVWNLSNGNEPKIEQLPDRQTESSLNQTRILEFPMSTVTLFRRRFPCSGGGYFRIFPYSLTRMALNRINREGRPFIFYFHPWEVDPDIPVIDHLPRLSKFRTYVNLSRTEERLKRLLADFAFVPLSVTVQRFRGSRFRG